MMNFHKLEQTTMDVIAQSSFSLSVCVGQYSKEGSIRMLARVQLFNSQRRPMPYRNLGSCDTFNLQDRH
jgi:hypothetical protein